MKKKYYSGLKNYLVAFIILTFTFIFCTMFIYIKDTFSLNTNSFSGIFTLFCIAFTFNEILDTLLKFLKEDKYDK